MARVLLPCEVEEWWEDKRLFILLSNIRSVNDLSTLITSHTRKDSEPTVLSNRLKQLSGLLVFLNKYCTKEESDTYTCSTLPFIAQSASKLDELVPESGVPFIVQQEAASLVLGRKLVLSLIANGFLGTFPESEYRHMETFSFNQLFVAFNKLEGKKELSSRAAKLKCVLCYFQKVADGRAELSGMITLRRQVILKEFMPSLTDWTAGQKPLCTLKVDRVNIIETAGSHTLQVDFANRKIGGGVLRGGCVQEEIKFVVFPELLISKLIMDHMDNNEAIIITGAEQFSKYTGYRDTFEFAGEHQDTAERDVFGNILTSTVAIDAYPFKNEPEKQYEPELVLRELNKAYAGYSCLQDRGDISTELIAQSVQGPSTAYIAEYYSDQASESDSDSTSVGNMRLSSLTDSNVCSGLTFKPGLLSTDFSLGAPPLSPIKELSESSVFVSIADTIIKGGVREATKKETNEQEDADRYVATLTSSLFTGVMSRPETVSVEVQQETEVKNQGINGFASNLTNSLFSEVSSKATPSEPARNEAEGDVDQFATKMVGSLFDGLQSKTTLSTGKNASPSAVEPTGKEADSSGENEAGDAVDQFAAKMASSLFGIESETKTAPVKDAHPPTQAVEPVDKDINSLASSLSSAILKSSVESSNTPPSAVEGDGKQSVVDDAKADELAKSIITDVFSSVDPAHAPIPPAKTLGEPTNQSLSSFSEQMANSIVTSAFYATQPLSGKPDHPAVFIQVERRGSLGLNESPKSSRSSSLTGQSITVHEFVNDLAEDVIRDSLSIAQFTSQSLDFQATPQAGEEAAKEVAEKVSHSIMESVKENSRQVPPKVLSPTEERPASLLEQDSLPLSRKVLKNRLLFSKQELAIVAARIAKRGSISDMCEQSDNDGPSTFHLNPRLLTPSSSRHSMGYAWSNASTRDESSRPVSPTDLDRIALGLSTDIDEYAHIFSKILVSDAILSVCGERPKRLRQEQFGEGYAFFCDMNSLPSENKVDSFLRRLEQMEVLSEASDDVVAPPSLQQKLKTVFLRPIATGNWGCGAFKGSPQFKCMLQLVVASMCERPQMVYFTHSNEELKDLERVYEHLKSKRWMSGQLCKALLDFANQPHKKRAVKDLFTTLLEM